MLNEIEKLKNELEKEKNKGFIMAIVGGDLTSKSRIRNTECTKGEEL